MEEEEWTAFFFSCDEELGEAVIFRFDARQILFLDGVVGSVFAETGSMDTAGKPLSIISMTSVVKSIL